MPHGRTNLNRPIVQIFPQDHVIAPFRSTVDDSISLNVDGSSTSVRFTAFCGHAGRVCIVQRIVILIESGSQMAPSDFGDVAALTNGLDLHVENGDDELLSKLFHFPVVNNAEFTLYTGTGFKGVEGGPGPGTDAHAMNLSLDALGFQMILRQEDKMVITVNDDLTDIDNIQAMIHGYTIPGDIG